jgi:hypothetical protein
MSGSNVFPEKFSTRSGTGCRHLAHRKGRTAKRRPLRLSQSIESLEPRLLLSAVEWLPGLVGPESLLQYAAGQVVYLDFDGGPGAYRGPVTVACDISGSNLAGAAGSQVAAAVADAVAPLGVSVVTSRPTDSLYSTVYVSGGTAFAPLDTSLWGIAEDIDTRNTRPDDNAFVFAGTIRTCVGDESASLAAIATAAAHEIGHLLGLAHLTAAPLTLGDLAYTQGDYSLFTGGPVHQYLTTEAYALYKAQFGASELDTYIKYIVTGSHDEDVASKDPFGNADGHYWGHSDTYDRSWSSGTWGISVGSQDSAVNRAWKYLTGGWGLNGVYDPAWETNAGIDGQGIWYKYAQGSTAGTYYWLGHVVHLLEDMTVPAHANADAHGLDDIWNAWDDYEAYIGDSNNWKDWNRTDVVGTIRTAAQVFSDIGQKDPFFSLFYHNAIQADNYASDDADGQYYHGDPGEDAVSQAIGDAMMPLAIKSVAELFRYYFQQVDTTAPTVSFALSTTEASPTLRQGRFTLTALGTDTVSGVDKDSYQFSVYRKSGASWAAVSDWTVDGSKITAPANAVAGTYRIRATATNGAGLSGTSADYYVQASPVYGDELPFTAAGVCKYIDIDGDTVTLTLKGGGTGLVYLGTTSAHTIIVVLNDTTEKSTLNIAVKRPNGTAGATTLNGIGTNGAPIASISAPTTDLSGTVTIGPATSAKGALTLTFDQISEAQITSAMLLKSLTASEWLDIDGTADTLTAPLVGGITIKGAPANVRLGIFAIRGDFQADVNITQAGTASMALTTLSVAGVMDGVAITAHSRAATGQSIGTLKAGFVNSATVTADAGINQISTSDWRRGTITAGWIGSVTAKVSGTFGGAGDWGASVVLTGAALPANKPTLGTVSIAHNLLYGSKWDVRAGFINAFTVTGTVEHSLICSAGTINSLTIGGSTASGFAAGVSYSYMQTHAYADSAHAPTAVIKSFTVKGLKVATGQTPPRFFISSYISAQITKMTLLNWDGIGGVYAPSGTVKSITYRDTADNTQNWIYPPTTTFIHVT